MSVMNRLVASFRRRLEMAVVVRGNSISQLLSPHMSARPEDVGEGETSLFTPEDDTHRWDGVQTLDRHWKRIADEVEFSPPRTALDLGMHYGGLEGRERGELAMLLEREYIHVDQPLDGMLEVGSARRWGRARSWLV
jgi:hypothetical protein